MTERRFYWLIGALALLLSSFPYLYGYLITPTGYDYTGLTLNMDDGYVYLAWMRQAADGAFFQRNLFTTEDQKGILFNLWFLLLGNIARATHLPLILVYHLGRVAGGIGLLVALVRLLHEVFSDPRRRMLAFALLCFASGVGWWWMVEIPSLGNAPIDRWQTEAITFLSLYYSPLFAPALACMVVFLASFLRAERTGQVRDLVPGMVAGFLVGNFHSYDILHLFAVVGGYRVWSDIAARQLDKAGWVRLILLGIAVLPTTAYQRYALSAEEVFRQRAFIGEGTFTPGLHWILLGFGLLVVLAVLARSGHFADKRAFQLALAWAVCGVLVAYLPFPFQRKLLMGAQIPYVLLAAAGLVALTEKVPLLRLIAVLLLVPSNVLFLLQDITRLDANVGSTNHRPYLSKDESAALAWMRANVPRDDFVLVAPDPTSHKRFPGQLLMPYLSVYIPALGNGIVYNGHWSETVAFGKKFGAMLRFFAAETEDSDRQAFLRASKIRYIVVPNALLTADPIADSAGKTFTPVRALPPFLRAAFQNDTVTIYEVME